MHYAPFPENDDRDACPNFPHDVFTSGDPSAEISWLLGEVDPLPAADIFLPERDPGNACRHRPSRASATMDHQEIFRSELAAGFEVEKKRPTWAGDVLLSV